jgi:acyl carrier protein
MSHETNRLERAVASRERVLADVKEIVAEQSGRRPDEIRETDSLIGDLGCDSLDIVEIAMEVEEHFDISVPDEAAEQAPTVAAIVDGVLQRLA